MGWAKHLLGVIFLEWQRAGPKKVDPYRPLMALHVVSVYCLLSTRGTCTNCVCRTQTDGLQMLDAFIKFVVCDPCSNASYQHLRLSLISTLSLKSIDNAPVIHYLLNLIPLMPVVTVTYSSSEYITRCSHCCIWLYSWLHGLNTLIHPYCPGCSGLVVTCMTVVCEI